MKGFIHFYYSLILYGILFIPTLLYASKLEPLHTVTEEFPPYSYSKDKTITGINTEIVQAVLKKAELESTLNIYPWSRALALAKNNSNTLIYAIRKTPIRKSLFYWIGTLVPTKTCLYSLKKNKEIDIAFLEDARMYKIITQLNGRTFNTLRKNDFSRFNIYQSHSVNKAYNMLINKHGDLLAYPSLSVKYATNYHNVKLDDVLKSEYCFPHSPPSYLALNIATDKAIAERLKKALADFKKGEEYNQILKKYGLIASCY